MSIIFTVFGILSFVMFAYAIYSYSKQVEQQRFEESWNEIKRIFDHDITEN